MGAALETVTGFLTTSSLSAGTYSALTAITGQSYTVRATPTSQAGSLLAPFAEPNTKGFFQVKSARMHDTTIGTTWPVPAIATGQGPYLLAGKDYDEAAWSTDVLTVQYTPGTTISAAETEVFSTPIYYPNLPGIAANFMTWQQVQSYVNPAGKTGDHYVTWVVPSSSGTKGQIGAGVAINSTNDQFKANHSYALLGFVAQAQFGTFLIQGTDTGNLLVGGPGSVDMYDTRNFFVDLSLAQGFATIPIIQANNKGGTLCYVIDGQSTSTAFTVGLVFMDLGVTGALGAA